MFAQFTTYYSYYDMTIYPGKRGYIDDIHTLFVVHANVQIFAKCEGK